MISSSLCLTRRKSLVGSFNSNSLVKRRVDSVDNSLPAGVDAESVQWKTTLFVNMIIQSTCKLNI
jgi:hypothetical protein